jgi:predicted DNA repair protein MutK
MLPLNQILLEGNIASGGLIKTVLIRLALILSHEFMPWLVFEVIHFA